MVLQVCETNSPSTELWKLAAIATQGLIRWGLPWSFMIRLAAFRETYPMRGQKGILIDGSGRLPSGESFTNEGDLKQLLIQRKDRVTQALD